MIFMRITIHTIGVAFHREHFEVHGNSIAVAHVQIPIAGTRCKSLAGTLVLGWVVGRTDDARLLAGEVAAAVAKYRFGHFEDVARLETAGHTLGVGVEE